MQSQKIGKKNNVNIFGRKETKEQKKESGSCLRSPMLNIAEPKVD
jgi:hypothetical protein